MTLQIVRAFRGVFAACAEWFAKLITAIDGSGFIIAAVVICFIVSMLLLPLRGRNGLSRDAADFSTWHPKKGEKGD